MKVKKAMLVYQAGIANVFAVKSFNLANFGRDAARLIQADFRTCEAFCQELEAAGVTVAVAGCNRAGEIAGEHWTDNLEELPFSDSFRPQGNWKR